MEHNLCLDKALIVLTTWRVDQLASGVMGKEFEFDAQLCASVRKSPFHIRRMGLQAHDIYVLNML